MLSRLGVYAEPHQWAAKHLGHTHGLLGNVFANPAASSSAPCPQESDLWISYVSEPIQSSQVEKNGNQTPSSRSEMPVWTVSQKFSRPLWGRLFQELCGRATTTTDFRSSFWQILHVSNVRLLEDKIHSQFLTEAMLWIKGVELVASVDDLKSSSSTRGISMPNFEVLDARIASALNKIIHNSHFKRISLEEQKAQKQDLFLRGRQIVYLIFKYFRVTGANDSVENYADLFIIALRNDDIQEFDPKWD